MNKKWTPHFAEIIDRLTIHQLKEVFIPEHKDKYSKEMDDMAHDLNMMIKEKNIELSGELIRSISVIAQMNAHIWYNESKARKGESQDLSLLKLTHGINGVRNRASNYMLDIIGDSDRQDWKTDCLAAEFKDWELSLFDEDD